MQRRSVLAAMLSILITLSLAPASRADDSEISLQSLLTEMIDRDQIARWPDPPYRCGQFSSYDRRSVSPRDIATWYANSDHSQFVRVEVHEGRTEHVMMDAEGPGAVVRFWSTWSVPDPRDHPQGTLRIYLDGADAPVIEGPISDILDRGALVGAPLGDGVSSETPYKYRGHNLYLPIPYAQRCRITYENELATPLGVRGSDVLYYQINYRTYPPGTPVRSYDGGQLEQLDALIGDVQTALRTAGRPPDGARRSRAHSDALMAGAHLELTASGPAAIRELTVKIDAPDLEQALRSTILEIDFDGRPCVWCPIGDFFGSGHRISPHRTWYGRVGDDGTLTCWWVMPFQESSTIRVRNVGEQAVDVELEAWTSRWTWDDRSMYFHAAWRELNHVRTRTNEGATHGAFDVNYITIAGRGVYAGDSLTLFNGAAVWWGEGDEKVFVDGESFPSHFGTGTEDYYGYAWGNGNRFDSPFHAQAFGGGAGRIDMVVNSRYRLLDAIPFTTSLKFDMELWHWAECTMNYAPTVFWYGRPGARGSVQPDPETAAIPIVKDREMIAPVYRKAGVTEGESLVYNTESDGVVEVQTGPPSWGWSGEQQLWWRGGAVGDVLSLTLPVEKAGRYRVLANLTKAIDYGIVRITINGESGVGDLDRFNDGVASDEIDLGDFALRAGVNSVEVEIVGANENAIAGHMFGVDYVRLEPE